jgi:hypothetical protein
MINWLTSLTDAVRANPALGVGAAAAGLVLYYLLQRKPRLQRDADARLAALRRENEDRYTKLRPPH